MAVFKGYLWKYSYLTLFYPLISCKAKTLRSRELLRPQLPFYFLELVSSCAFSWILSVFFTSLLQAAYKPHDVSSTDDTSLTTKILAAAKSFVSNEKQALGGLLITACLLSTTVNMVVMDRIFAKVYMLNIKFAFKDSP